MTIQSNGLVAKLGVEADLSLLNGLKSRLHNVLTTNGVSNLNLLEINLKHHRNYPSLVINNT